MRVRASRWASPLLAASLVVGPMLAACAPAGPTGPPPSVPTDPATPGPADPSAPTGPVVLIEVDDDLLAVLPAAVDGQGLTLDTETAASVAGDPDLAADVAALAVGLYAGAQDYAVVSVARLRDGVFDEAWFRAWRDSFDAAVCEQAGGVDGHAEAPIAGRTVYIGTCAGGVRTYHVRLARPDRVISLQALGDARYGELILAGLTE